MSIETEADRLALTSIWDDVATVEGGGQIRGQYFEPQAEDQLVEGTAPTFLSALEELTNAGVTIGTNLSSVTTHYGQTRGPFRVVRWQVQDDGAFVLLSLNQT